MGTSFLDWTKISWKDFQRLTVHFGQNIFKDVNFEEFLKDGNKQDGIDIISVANLDGKYITIQCKHKHDITDSDLNRIIGEFAENQFFAKTSTFILCTTADLQNRKIRQSIAKHQQRLASSNISFQVWDCNYLNEQLANNYNLVAFFFGKDSADMHCFSHYVQGQKAVLTPITGVKRKICEFNRSVKEDQWGWHFAARDPIDLTQIFSENRFDSKKICLIGEAYQGKSFLLKQAYYDLERITYRYTVFLLELKIHDGDSIEGILNTFFSNWKESPAKDILVIIDGLDEVPTDKFIGWIKKINAFISQYSYLNIVFSCRKLFFQLYKIADYIQEVSIYELYPILEDDLNEYLKSQLGARLPSFIKQLTRTQMRSLIYEPFYLSTLLEEYKTVGTLPKSKILVTEKFIESSFRRSENRELSRGRRLHQRVVDYKKAIKKLAFSLQFLGLNALDDECVQQVFDEQEIELLQHNSLVIYTNDKWAFSNALFQEHLTASVLSAYSIEEILGFICIGDSLKKIKTKWIQTVASLLSMLDPNADKFKKIVEVIKNDNVELIFLSEKSKFTATIRMEFFKELLRRLIKYDISPMIIDGRAIATFIFDDKEIISYAIEFIDNNKCSEHVMILLARCIKLLHLDDKQKHTFMLHAKRIILETGNYYCANQLLEALASQGLGNREFIEAIISSKEANESHEYRDGVYQLVQSLNLVNEFYDYGLDGLHFLIKHNQVVSHGGSEFALEDFWTSTDLLDNIWKLISKISSDEWLNFYRYTTRKKQLLRKIVSLAVELFDKQPFVFFAMFDLVKTIQKRYHTDEFEELDLFFAKTGTGSLALKMAIPQIKAREYEYGGFLTEECFSYLLFEWEQGTLTENNLWDISVGVQSKRDVYEKFLRYCNDAMQGEFTGKSTQISEYQQSEIIRRENDVKYIQTKDAFAEGVKSYFRAFGSNSIPEDLLYVDDTATLSRKYSDSNIVFRYLLSFKDSERKISLSECLKPLNDDENFSFFRASEILDYNFNTDSSDSVMKEILQNYYSAEVIKADFANTYVDERTGDKTIRRTFNRKNVLLGDIYKKFQFKTPPGRLISMVWLITEGVNVLRESYNGNSSTSLASKIINALDDEHILSIQEQIVTNLKGEIRSEWVLASHVGLCRHFKIIEASEAILNCIKNSITDEYLRYEILKVYIELGGDKFQLYGTFIEEPPNSYGFLFLAQEFAKDSMPLIEEVLLSVLRSDKCDENRKKAVASLLCANGITDGFDYIFNLVERDGLHPFSGNDSIDVKLIPTGLILKTLNQCLNLLIDKDIEGVRFYEKARYFIIDILKQTASKSESDLQLCYEFLMNRITKELEAGNVAYKKIYWNAIYLLEEFRNSDEKQIRTVKDLQKIFSIHPSMI